jgi:hypothetical protein
MTIALTSRKIRGNIYVLTPADALSPGEYSFSPEGGNEAYCFGVDAAGR